MWVHPIAILLRPALSLPKSLRWLLRSPPHSCKIGKGFTLAAAEFILSEVEISLTEKSYTFLKEFHQLFLQFFLCELCFCVPNFFLKSCINYSYSSFFANFASLRATLLLKELHQLFLQFFIYELCVPFFKLKFFNPIINQIAINIKIIPNHQIILSLLSI